MKRLLDTMGMFIGSYLGWVLGASLSLFTAFIFSMVGLGGGLYAARRISKQLLP